MAIDRPPPVREAGVHRLSVVHGGRSRSWTVAVPASGVTGGLTVVLHGVGATGEAMRGFGFEPLAAAAGVVLAYPDAVDGSWNDGRPGVASVAHREQVDDVGFLLRLVEVTAAETGADPGRISVIGFSNGAMMASRLACEQAPRVRAVVLVAAAAGAHQPALCRPAAPVAVLVIASTTDPVVPFTGGVVSPGGTRGEAAPVEDVLAGWASVNGCHGQLVTAVPDAPVSTVRSTGCAPGAPVVLHRVETGGHDWWRFPGFDTTTAAWAFLTREP